MSGQIEVLGGLGSALRDARERESARLDAVTEIRDAQTLRLYALKQDLLQGLASGLPKAGFIELALIAGNPPRLWVDLISSVVMAPDPRTFRFEIDTQNGREVLLETRDREEMAQTIIAHLAHRIIDRERLSVRLQGPVEKPEGGYSGAAVMLAWLSGFALGIFALFAILTGMSSG